MKLSELKPCPLCNGPLLSQGMATWRCIRVSHATLDRRAAREVVGLTTMFGGALGLAEVMAPAAEDAVLVMGDKDKALMDEVHICYDCYVYKLEPLMLLVEE